MRHGAQHRQARPARTLGYITDKLLALGSLVFLTSAMLSFVSIRASARALRLEAMAEWIFLGGLGLLSAVTVVIAFAIAQAIAAGWRATGRCR